MIRVSLQARNKLSGERQTSILFGKTYYDDEGARTNSLMHQLWEGQSELHIAPPLAYDARRRILWQMGLSGRTLLTLAGNTLDESCFLKWLDRAGAAVALLHQTPLAFPPNSRTVDWLADL